MNRSAKGFRVAGSVWILLNLAAFFQPVTERMQENYPTLQWFQLDFIKGIFEKSLPHEGETALYGITAGQVMWILIFMLLPLLLSLIAGIWGIVGNSRQITSCIMVFVIFGMYIIMLATLGTVWPEASSGQIYESGPACKLHLIFSGVSAIMAIAALMRTPRKVKTTSVNIPHIQEIKKQQVEAKYSVVATEEKKREMTPENKPYNSANPRGVMVGLTGIYAGAEIPFANGEYIKLGRHASNHLVFEGLSNVSREHCRIKWDAGRKKYVFCDYSSNGSFVNGSTDCLPQNLEIDMEPGTVVAIGDETNMFRLE